MAKKRKKATKKKATKRKATKKGKKKRQFNELANNSVLQQLMIRWKALPWRRSLSSFLVWLQAVACPDNPRTASQIYQPRLLQSMRDFLYWFPAMPSGADFCNVRNRKDLEYGLFQLQKWQIIRGGYRRPENHRQGRYAGLYLQQGHFQESSAKN